MPKHAYLELSLAAYLEIASLLKHSGNHAPFGDDDGSINLSGYSVTTNTPTFKAHLRQQRKGCVLATPNRKATPEGQ